MDAPPRYEDTMTMEDEQKMYQTSADTAKLVHQKNAPHPQDYAVTPMSTTQWPAGGGYAGPVGGGDYTGPADGDYGGYATPVNAQPQMMPNSNTNRRPIIVVQRTVNCRVVPKRSAGTRAAIWCCVVVVKLVIIAIVVGTLTRN